MYDRPSQRVPETDTEDLKPMAAKRCSTKTFVILVVVAVFVCVVLIICPAVLTTGPDSMERFDIISYSLQCHISFGLEVRSGNSIMF